ncbi:MAG: YicC family protein [Marinilabiliales bacterium]|nr:MAG: YicC family protein [Marinilabiliales bacterium]
MLFSMTGYGKSQKEGNDVLITVQVRTLNSKQCDQNIKLPQRYREKEQEIRQLACNILKRGKIDVLINAETIEGNGNFTIDHQKALHYHSELKNLSEKMSMKSNDDLLGLVLKMPDVVIPSSDELNEEEWFVLKDCTLTAVNECMDFRKKEGAALEKTLINHATIIEQKLSHIPEYEKERIEYQRNKIVKELEKLPQNQDYNPARFEEEMVYYLEKADITEEKVRLAQHIQYFNQTIKEANSDGTGKKLSFIAQEMGREINTLGNKAAHFEIQKLVVEMKDELEKIKEQVLNIL